MTIIQDDKGRAIIKIDNGKIAVARFPDLSDKAKDYLVAVYADVTMEDPVKLRDFLDYKSDENEFCV